MSEAPTLQAPRLAPRPAGYRQLLQSEVIPNEVRAPLPRRLQAAQAEGLEDFYARSAELSP
jgi:hypothetical protein